MTGGDRIPAPPRPRRLRTVATVLGVVLAAAALGLAVRPLVTAPTVVPTEAAAPPTPAAPPTATPVPPVPTQTAAPPAPSPPPRTASPAPAPTAHVAAPPVEPRLRPFAGLSTWIDIYDTDLTPSEQVDRAAAGGVQVLFLQSARHKSTDDIDNARRYGEVIELAHDHGMLVMGWYVPDFVRPARDLRRSQAAMAFQSPRGDRVDAFGLDIEIEDNPDVAERSARLLDLSRALREWAGPEYPMAAIVLPPLQLELRPSWWPDFPYAELRPYYDVYIPMSYSSFRGTDARTTYRWNVDNVAEMRERAQDPALPVHIAGGIADRFPRVDAFVRAVRDSDALGGGLYDLHTTHPDAWPILAQLRVEEPER